MYAIFLLVLLADVARLHASVPIEGDATGSFILSAASQLCVNSTGGAVLVFGRADGSFPRIAGFKSYTLTRSGWSRVLPGQSNASHPMLLSAVFESKADAGSPFVSELHPTSPSLAIFEHTGSPAP
jgi:hypothetical protein